MEYTTCGLIDVIDPRNVTYSGLADTIVTKSNPITIENDYRYVQKERGLSVAYNHIPQRITSPIDVRKHNGNGGTLRIPNALWDTGAVNCLIKDSLAKELNLEISDQGVICSATGQVDAFIYFLDICLTNDLVIPGVRVFGSPMTDRKEEFIIGMDIISKGRFSLNTVRGKTTMRFTMPSGESLS